MIPKAWKIDCTAHCQHTIKIFFGNGQNAKSPQTYLPLTFHSLYVTAESTPQTNTLMNEKFHFFLYKCKTMSNWKNQKKYQPSGKGGTQSTTTTPHCLQNSKCRHGAPKLPTGSGKVVLGHSLLLLLKKFFDPRSHSIRKGCNGEEKKRMVH